MLSLKNTLKENPKLLVIFGLLVLLFTVTSLLQPSFRDPATLTNTMRWIGLFGIISIGIRQQEAKRRKVAGQLYSLAR